MATGFQSSGNRWKKCCLVLSLGDVIILVYVKAVAESKLCDSKVEIKTGLEKARGISKIRCVNTLPKGSYRVSMTVDIVCSSRFVGILFFVCM